MDVKNKKNMTVILGEPNIPTPEQIEINRLEELERVQKIKKAEVEDQSHILISADIPYETNLFQTNYAYPPPNNPREPITVSMPNRIRLMNDEDVINWITRSNIEVQLSKTDMEEILRLFYERQSTIIFRAREIKKVIEELDDVDLVENFPIVF